MKNLSLKAKKGFSLIELLIVVVIIAIIAAIAIPNLLAARRSSNDASALATMRVLSSGEHTYKSTAGDGLYGDLTQLNNADIIDDVVASGSKSGFLFSVIPTGPTPGNPAVFDGYAIAAVFGGAPSWRRRHRYSWISRRCNALRYCRQCAGASRW